jgi:DNA-binding response OmpR family regulator
MDASRPRALVVEDDAALRLLARVNLELEGFEVRDAATLPDAVAALETEQPDVVLLDLHLGGVASHPLLELLRATGVPVAVVTGSADPDAVRGLADAVLVKPFAPQDLVDVARRLARVPRP